MKKMRCKIERERPFRFFLSAFVCPTRLLPPPPSLFHFIKSACLPAHPKPDWGTPPPLSGPAVVWRSFFFGGVQVWRLHRRIKCYIILSVVATVVDLAIGVGGVVYVLYEQYKPGLIVATWTMR